MKIKANFDFINIIIGAIQTILSLILLSFTSIQFNNIKDITFSLLALLITSISITVKHN